MSDLSPVRFRVLLRVLGCSWMVLALPAALAADEPMEPLRVHVAYSPRLRQVPGWSADLDCAVARVSSVLEGALGREIKLRSKEPWFGASVGRAPRDLRQALVEEVERQGADLVLGLAVHARRPPPGPRPEGIQTEPSLDFTQDEGLTHYTEGYLVVDVMAEEICDTYRLLAHEVAHVFGGVHRSGRRFLMDPGGVGVDVDPLNAELLALHSDRGFGRGQAPLSGEEVRTMWRLARADVEAAGTWLVVGILGARMGKPDAAVKSYERALAIDPDHREAHVNLGHARFQMGDLRAAEASYLVALEKKAEDGLVANNLAAVYYGLGEPRRAAAYLKKALELGYEVNPLFVAELEKVTGEKLADEPP